MSSMSFDSQSIESAIKTGNFKGESFDSLMGKEAFYQSDKLYTAAVKIINSYEEHKNMPALKRAYDILSNTEVTSLPIHKTGLVSSYYMWGYNSAKSQSEKIITTHFSEYLQTIANRPGHDLENKLAKHDLQVEHYLKAFDIPDNEWSELKSLISQGKEAEAQGQWNNILSKVRIAAPNTFSGTKEVEDFLLGHKTIQHVLQPKTPLQARFLSVFTKLDPFLLKSENFPYPVMVENGVILCGSPQQTQENHRMYQAHWAKLQVAVLTGNEKRVDEIWNFPVDSHILPTRFLDRLNDITFEMNVHLRSVLNQSHRTIRDNMEEGKVTPIPLDNRIYFAAAAPKDESTLETFKKSLFEYNVNVIVDLRGELEIPAQSIPQRVGEEFNGIKLLDRKDEKIDQVDPRGQYLTRMTLEVTSAEGQKKKITLLQVHHWMGGVKDKDDNNTNIEENALRYISYEAAKLERSTKGRMLVTSENGGAKTSSFILYHHLSQNKKFKNRKEIDDAYLSAQAVYKSFATTPKWHDDTAKITLEENRTDKIQLQNISTQNMELDDFLTYAIAITVDTLKIQNSVLLTEEHQTTLKGQFEHFVSNLSEADKKLCLSALADTLSYVSPKRGKPEPVQRGFFYLLNQGITFQQLLDKYKQTFNENDADVTEVFSAIVDPKKFIEMYPESKNYSALYHHYEKTLELQGNPHTTVDVIRNITKNMGTQVIFNYNIFSGIKNALVNNLEAINAFANQNEIKLIKALRPVLFTHIEFSQIPLLDPYIFQNIRLKQIGITTPEQLAQLTLAQKTLSDRLKKSLEKLKEVKD